MGPHEVLDSIRVIFDDFFYKINIGLRPVHVNLGAFNTGLVTIFPWVVLVVFIGYNIFYIIKNRKKRDVIPQAIIWIIAEVLLVAVFWIVPELALQYSKIPHVLPIFRWGLILPAFIGIAYVYGHENGERRWLYSATGHIAVFVLGWLANQWVGILFLSIPLALTYYCALYVMAMIALPASNPDNTKERWKRFIILVAYTWGSQFPMLVVTEHARKEPETRIKGDFTRDLPIPGLIWGKSHHIAGITNGTQFMRVDGPGTIFTGKLERPFQVIDLRLQIRSNEIEAVSKDGINFFVRVFAAFRMDPDVWDEKTHTQIRNRNPILQGAGKPSYTEGSFPFSHARVQSAISMVESWDEWAMNIVKEEARKVVSQKKLDEFWRPAKDEKKANAMNFIAQEVKERAEWTLRSKGILLVAARIVNFRFGEKGETDEVSQQQIATWAAEWARKSEQKLADANSEAEKYQQEARAYAESVLLNSIAEALKKIRDIDHDLPRSVIAMRYLSALENYARKNTPEEEETINEAHNNLRNQQ